MTGSPSPASPGPTAPAALVESFRESKARVEALARLQALGPAALPAVREGLRHPDWHVRHWCAIYQDHNATPDSLRDLVPLLTDPVTRVRLWAVHSISCEGCKDHECRPIDVVPLLIERVEKDASTRVRKMAVAMLTTLPLDSRVPPVFRAVLGKEADAKIRLHAENGLRKYRDAGMA
jgi:HEAT repeat protein